jgi:hypothetical protein
MFIQFMRRNKARKFKHGIGLGRLSLMLLFAVAAASWLAWPLYGSAAGAGAGKIAPKITGANWLNSKPLNSADLKGRVVLVEFWTYG